MDTVRLIRRNTMSHPIHLILSPGTRVVTRNDTASIGGEKQIGAGAVGEVVDSPADATHAYKIRFNDGLEAMLRRTEFSILKEFKMGREESPGNSPQTTDFDFWESFIVYRCIVGSRAFGLSHEGSDTDRRGIYLPPAESHWSLYGIPEQIERNETEEMSGSEYWRVRPRFLVEQNRVLKPPSSAR